MDRKHGEARYTTLMASDVVRDGMGLELYCASEGQDCLVAEVFYSDATHHWTMSTFDCNVPLELIEELIAEARLRLPPNSSL